MDSPRTYTVGKSGQHQTEDRVFTRILLLTAVPRFRCRRFRHIFETFVHAYMQAEATRVISYQSNLQHDMMRALRQTADTATQVSVVKTARDLQQAVSAGKRHIEIRQHLDLTPITSLYYDDNYEDSWSVLNVSSNTLSIRVCLTCIFLAVSMHTSIFPQNCRA
jgi:hypothetical protein